MDYYSEKIQIKTSKGKIHTESRKDQARGPSCPCPVEQHEQRLSLPAMTYDNRCDVLPARDAHVHLDVRGFY